MFFETSYDTRYPRYYPGLSGLAGACEDEVARKMTRGYLFKGDRVRFTSITSNILLPTGYSRDTMNSLIAAAGFTNVQSKVDREGGRLVVTIEATAMGDMSHHDDACSIFISNVRRYFPDARTTSCGVIERADICGGGGSVPVVDSRPPSSSGGSKDDKDSSTPGTLDQLLNDLKNMSLAGSIGVAVGIGLVLVLLTRK